MKVSGKCNLCGECCGYPTTKGEQFQPFPKDMMNATRDWLWKDVLKTYPFFNIVEHPHYGGKAFGSVKFEGETIHWIWTENGLCTDLKPYGNPETASICCPFFSKGKGCLLYLSEEWHWIWKEVCNPYPQIIKEKRFADAWERDFPSCSLTLEWEDES